jgi:hypothetical protein
VGGGSDLLGLARIRKSSWGRVTCKVRLGLGGHRGGRK